LKGLRFSFLIREENALEDGFVPNSSSNVGCGYSFREAYELKRDDKWIKMLGMNFNRKERRCLIFLR